VGDDLEVYEDQLLDTLREGRLITYPSPLLGRLVEDLPEGLEEEVLKKWLDPTGRLLAGYAGGARVQGCGRGLWAPARATSTISAQGCGPAVGGRRRTQNAALLNVDPLSVFMIK